jgi:hypothetical protein
LTLRARETLEPAAHPRLRRRRGRRVDRWARGCGALGGLAPRAPRPTGNAEQEGGDRDGDGCSHALQASRFRGPSRRAVFRGNTAQGRDVESGCDVAKSHPFGCSEAAPQGDTG